VSTETNRKLKSEAPPSGKIHAGARRHPASNSVRLRADTLPLAATPPRAAPRAAARVAVVERVTVLREPPEPDARIGATTPNTSAHTVAGDAGAPPTASRDRGTNERKFFSGSAQIVESATIARRPRRIPAARKYRTHESGGGEARLDRARPTASGRPDTSTGNRIAV